MGLDVETPEGIQALRVVLLEREVAARAAMREVLEEAGFAVLDAGDVAEALQILESEQCDALLGSLPADRGLELCHALRERAALRYLPVIFLAAPLEAASRYRAIAAGADEVLQRPVGPSLLAEAIRARIARARLLRPQAPGSAEAQLRGGQLRRGEFLAQLGTALRDGSRHWQVLMALRIDQNQAIAEKLGQAASFELEQAIAARFAGALRAEDAYTLWMEFGFGLLVERNRREEVEVLARELCARVAGAPFELRGQRHALTLSVGVALPPGAGDAGDPDRWFASAYAAQSIAHRNGGNRHEGVLSREYGHMPPERVLIIREWAKEAHGGDNVLIEFQPMLPLLPRLPGMYALDAKLRDYRAPLAGVPRREYLKLAREAGSLRMIDRMSLFEAFEAIDHERAAGRGTRLLVPVDLASCDEAQLAWLESELRRRRAASAGLVLEFDAASALASANFATIVARLHPHGVGIAIAKLAGGLVGIPALARLPADWLRLPAASIHAAPAEEFRQAMQPWFARERGLIAACMEHTDGVSKLSQLNVGYIQGDAIAAGGLRLDYSFAVEG